MADTTFEDFKQPAVNAAWLNDVNDNIYDASPAPAGTLKHSLGVPGDVSRGAGMIGLGPVAYPPNTVGAGMYTTVWANGATSVHNELASANSLGLPIRIIGACVVTTAVTINVPIMDSMYQLFVPGALVTIDNGLPVRPEWFGSAAGNIRHAVNSLPFNGGTVLLADRTYPPSYDTATPAMFDNRGGTPGLDYMVKKHVRIQGSKLPEYNADNTQMFNGSIIQGTFYVSSECEGFQVDLVGNDCGPNVVAGIYGGVDHDGFCFLQCNKAAPVYGANVHIGRIRALGSGASSLAHALLFESIDGGVIEYAEGRNSNHGVVIKSRNIRAGILWGSLNHGEDVIIKSDYYATMENITVDQIVSAGSSPGPDAGFGLLILADAASGGNVQIGSVQVDRKTNGIQFQANGASLLTDVTIGRVVVRSCPTAVGWGGAGTMRCRIQKATLTAGSFGVVVPAAVVDLGNGIDQITAVNFGFAVDVSGKLSLGDVHLEDCTQSLYFRTLAARIMVSGAVVMKNVANPWNVITPALTNSWANVGSNDPFTLKLRAGQVYLSGLINAGTNGNIAVLPSIFWPPNPLRFICSYYNGASYVSAEVLVDTTGQISVSAGATPSPRTLSLRGVSWEIPF